MLRQYNPKRSIRQDIPVKRDDIAGTEQLYDNPHQLAIEQLVPRIANRMQHTVAVDRREVYYYQRKKVGRKCSCHVIDSAPDGQCLICFATGIVGGYTKFGFRDETIDVSYHNLSLTNVKPLYELASKPVLFGMTENTLYGCIYADITILANRRNVDSLIMVDRKDNKETFINYFIKKPSETDYVLLTSDSLKARLDVFKLNIKVEFRRLKKDIETPYLSHIYIRYQIGDIIKLNTDVARHVESIVLEEYGIRDSYTSVSVVFDNTIPTISTNDFIIRLDLGNRWKVTEENQNKPFGILTSHESTVRLINPSEIYTRVP